MKNFVKEYILKFFIFSDFILYTLWSMILIQNKSLKIEGKEENVFETRYSPKNIPRETR